MPPDKPSGIKLNPVPLHALKGFGVRLKRLRTTQNVKQAYVARIADVDQATVSRWERGLAQPGETQIDRVLAALQPNTFEDSALRRLIESSSLTAHLITDVDHRLLAASPSRECEWGVSANQLRGQSVWAAASPTIVEAEQNLSNLGWWDTQNPAKVTIELDAFDNGFLPIIAGHMVWERVWLQDGSPARLCTLHPGRVSSA